MSIASRRVPSTAVAGAVLADPDTQDAIRDLVAGASSVTWFGAKGDGIAKRGTASISSGGAVLTVSDGSFTSADIGKRISVYRAGASSIIPGLDNDPLNTTIGAVASSTQVTLAAGASNTVSGEDVVYGTDDTSAIQAALDAALNVYFPPGIYFVRRSLKTRNYHHVHGAGRGASWLFCDQSTAQTGWKAGFWVGNYHPYGFDADNPSGNRFPSYAANAVALGDNVVTTTAASDAGSFGPDDAIVVATTGQDNQTAAAYPYFFQLTLVRSADASTGAIALLDPIRAAIGSAIVYKVTNPDPANTLNGGMPWHIVRDVQIRDMTIEALDLFALRTGAYNFRPRRLEGYRTRSGPNIQGAHDHYEDIVHDWWYGGVEVKCGSYDYSVRNCRGRYRGQGSTTVGAISIGEQSFDGLLERLDYTIPSSVTTAIAAATLGRTFRTRLSSSKIRHLGNQSTAAVLQVNANDYTGYGPNDNSVEDCELRNAATTPRHVAIAATSASMLPTNLRISRCRAPDTPATESIRAYNTTSARFRDNELAGATKLTADSGALGLDYDRATVPGEWQTVTPGAFDALSGSTLPAKAAYAGSRGIGWQFQPAIDSVITTELHAPPWARAATVRIEHTRGSGTPAGGTVVQWDLIYSAVADGGAMAVTETAVALATSSPATDTLKVSTFAADATVQPNGKLRLKLRRKGAATTSDTMTDLTAFVVGLAIYWKP